MRDTSKAQIRKLMRLLEWADTYLQAMENCTSGGIGDDITRLRQQIEQVLECDPQSLTEDSLHD